MSENRDRSSAVEIPPTGVYIANVNPGNLGLHFTRSLIDLVRADINNGWNVWRGTLYAESGANISKHRNELITRFLAMDDGEWLLFLDSDMVFKPDIIVRLLGAAQRADCKVIGGLCVMIGSLGPIPTLYQYDDIPGSDGITRVQFDYPDNSLLQVAATGGACLIIHRDVLEAYQRAQAENKAWLVEHKDDPLVSELVARDLIHDPSEEFGWFSERVRVRRVIGRDGEALSREHWVSEDIEFCLRLGALGFPMYVDCTLEVGHHKHGRTWYASDIRDGIGIPRSPVVAVIPVKDKLSLTRDLVHQIREQGGCDEIVVCDNGSGRETKNWLGSQDDITVLDCPDVGIHHMWNQAVDHALEGHGARVRIAFLNNDLRLGPAFLRTLSQALTDHREYTAVSGNYDGRRAGTPVVRVTDICANRYDQSGGLAGFAFMVRGEWFSSGYRFPEQCMWWFGDNDLVASLAYSDTDDAPKRCGIVLAAEVEHLDGGGGTAGDWSGHSEQLAKDREAFEERWRRFYEADRKRKAMAAGDLTPLYDHLCETPSDINEHLPTLHDLALKLEAQNIIELGVRGGVSTVAWLTALQQTGGHLWAVDVQPVPGSLAGHPGMTFTQGDDLDPFVLKQIPDGVDIVFVDTDHTYEQTKAEIEAYAPKVRPGGVLVFHDSAVEIHAHHAPGQPLYPVRQAVQEWAEAGDLDVVEYENNFGLMVVTL